MDHLETSSSEDPLSRAREIASSDSVFLHELLEAFVDDASSRVDSIREAIDEGDTELALKLLHAIKGSASSIGSDRVAARAGELETLLHEGGGDGVALAMDRLGDEYARLEEVIRQELER